jgi:hypothetical protein
MEIYISDSVAVTWALRTIRAIEYAPALAIEAAVDAAADDPRSLIAVRHELEHSDPDAWQAIKRHHLRRLAANAMSHGEGNPARRIYAALSRPSVASHLRAILSAGELKRISEFLGLMRTARRVGPLGELGIHAASLKAIKSRAPGMLAHLRQTASAASLLRAGDDWFGDGAGALGFVDRIIVGEEHAMLTLREMRRFASGDWRWRVLFGHLIRQAA